MKKLFLLLLLFVSFLACSQTRHSKGVILGDPSGTSSDPTGVKEGQIYWNSTLSKFRQYNGTVWADLSSGASGSGDVTKADDGDGFTVTGSGSSLFTTIGGTGSTDANIKLTGVGLLASASVNTKAFYIIDAENTLNRAGLQPGTGVRNFVFPASSGTLALTSDLASLDTSEWVTYTGSRLGGDLLVTFGDYDDTNNGTKLIINESTEIISIPNSELVVAGAITAQNGIYFDAGLGTSIQGSATTVQRIITWPNASGTVALTSDLSSFATTQDLSNYVSKTATEAINGVKTFNDNVVLDDAVSMNGEVEITSLSDGNLVLNGGIVETKPLQKVYTAILSQNNSANSGNPVVVAELENTLGATITWTKSATGSYIATASSTVFTLNKVACIVSGGFIIADTTFKFQRNSTSVCVLNSYVGGSVADNTVSNTVVEIRVYP
jgi:hypothetical protein